MTTAGDIILAAQQRADRVNASTITPAEWLYYFNSSAGALYRLLTSTYEDYNVKSYDFTLQGGDKGNKLYLGPGTSVPDFDKLRHVASNVQPIGTTTAFCPVLKADSPMHFDQLSAPLLNTYYGAFIQVFYWLWGNTLEIRPSANAGQAYRMHYVPVFRKLVNLTDTIDGTWMASNGIDEFIVLGAAAKALIKEESLETAQIILQEQAQLGQSIMSQFSNRDDGQPARIVDVKRAKAFVGWGTNGRSF